MVTSVTKCRKPMGGRWGVSENQWIGGGGCEREGGISTVSINWTVMDDNLITIKPIIFSIPI